MKIYIDGDACPVKDIVIEVGMMEHIPIYIVCSLSHVSQYPEQVTQIIVDNVSQATDLVIMNRIVKGDIVITQDYGLASIVIAKGAYALHHNGMPYTEQNIDELLYQRHVSSKIRRSGGKTKGPKPFTAEDRQNFRIQLVKLIQTLRDNA